MEEQYEWERAKTLIDPRKDLITDVHGNLYTNRYIPDEGIHTRGESKDAPLVVPFVVEAEEAAPLVGPSFSDWGPTVGPPPSDVQQQNLDRDLYTMGGDPEELYRPGEAWSGPHIPEFYGEPAIPDWEDVQPQTAEPGPPDREFWGPNEGEYFPDPTDPEDPAWRNVPGPESGMGTGDILPDERGKGDFAQDDPTDSWYDKFIPWEGKTPDVVPGSPGEWDTGGMAGIGGMVALMLVMTLIEK